MLTSAFAHFAPRIHAQAVVARQGEDLAKSSKYRAANRDRAKPLGPAHAPVRTHLRFSEKRRTKKWPERFRPRDVVPLDGLEPKLFSFVSFQNPDLIDLFILHLIHKPDKLDNVPNLYLSKGRLGTS